MMCFENVLHTSIQALSPTIPQTTYLWSVECLQTLTQACKTFKHSLQTLAFFMPPKHPNVFQKCLKNLNETCLVVENALKTLLNAQL